MCKLSSQIEHVSSASLYVLDLKNYENFNKVYMLGRHPYVGLSHKHRTSSY